MKASDVMKLKPVDLEKTVDQLMARNQLTTVRHDLEAIAKTATLFASYCSWRESGCSHEQAVVHAQSAAEIVWCKALGFNGYHKFTF